MNKAAFLNIVRQVAPIQDQEVDDLERLVVSFPYCQTAHVLLAKAAHDRGSMLSTQKLRRAAAHVSNRQLLKQLVYATPMVEETVVPVFEEEQDPEAYVAPGLEPFSEKEALNAPEPETGTAEEPETEPFLAEETSALEVLPEVPAEEEVQEEEAYTAENHPEAIPEAEATAIAPEVTHLPEEQPETIALGTIPESAAIEETAPLALPELAATVAQDTLEAPEEEAVIINEAAAAEEEALDIDIDVSLSEEEDTLDELLELIQISSLTSFSAPIPSVNLTHEEIVSEIISGHTPLEEEMEVSAAPEIIPAAQEKAAQEEADLSAYLQIAELDSLYDTSGYEFPTLKLPDYQQSHVAEEPTDPYLSIFTQNNLAYWMGSSRLGESIQLKDELTSVTPFYFQPELILEHVKEQATPAPAPEPTPAAKLDMQLDIINQFLKSAPKRKTMANAQLSNEPQEDLSAKSSKIKKNLASENLAHIFIKQGKGKKAIKIYEQLIVKFPEKKSYFAEQIEKLRNE
ncbi:hypothetical protein EFA69_17190 [Rufibacter immobilis]|uniref:Tetratricopeptide repeat protein n=1 Tax=Rufibacter immobilis TaxID=1348778 RepID=A0A3M9MSF7_9BACT|nr:hypothetical protein [Rufibacter immobilis]RNI27833.1 hypothetical protein EFA69_17190 [Rufibacter immobilis]